MEQSSYIWFALPAILLWIAATVTVYTGKKRFPADILIPAGSLFLILFIVHLWIERGNAPLGTMENTRLWFSLFISLTGYATFRLWRYKWLLAYSVLTGSVFLIINLFSAGNSSMEMSPALKSFWFIPHVTVYIFAYAISGASAIAAVAGILHMKKRDETLLFGQIDRLVYVGTGLLITGMIMGAVWAKEAWGEYWSWDPKETWALITLLTYLIYIHLRSSGFNNKRILWLLPVAFLLLLFTWAGINYLPAAGGSLHVY
jgi:ABC-type transport system involved in cytochrome c biogenesis permease subunit